MYYKCTNDQVNLLYSTANQLVDYVCIFVSFRLRSSWKFECGSCCVRAAKHGFHSHSHPYVLHINFINYSFLIGLLCGFVVVFSAILSVNIFWMFFFLRHSISGQLWYTTHLSKKSCHQQLIIQMKEFSYYFVRVRKKNHKKSKANNLLSGTKMTKISTSAQPQHGFYVLAATGNKSSSSFELTQFDHANLVNLVKTNIKAMAGHPTVCLMDSILLTLTHFICIMCGSLRKRTI